MMWLIYNWFLRLMVPIVLVRLLWRGIRNRGYWFRWSERFAYAPAFSSKRRIWLHAVSVGEVRAAVPLIRELLERYRDHALLVTTMTPTGSDQLRSLFGTQVEHCYVPYDLPSVVKRFLTATQPELALIMETELWPNLFQECAKHGVPIIVSNVRMSQKSMDGYLKFKGLATTTLANVKYLACQGEQDAVRMLAIGASEDQIRITGSLKFEYRFPASLVEQGDAYRQAWGGQRPVWVAASTRLGEDEKVLQAYDELKRLHEDLILIIVPRHPERFTPVTRLAEKSGYRVKRRSDYPDLIPPDTDILVGDTMGELLLFISTSDVVFMGGSLVKTGGHNLLEPAAAGKPVVFGPYMYNFADISRMVLERGAGIQINSASELAPVVDMYIKNTGVRFAAGQAGKELVEQNRGALEKNLDLVRSVLGG
jgi:3-deoxy-D-manno-octulosonic-acid transferase